MEVECSLSTFKLLLTRRQNAVFVDCQVANDMEVEFCVLTVKLLLTRR
jgi:hypothetical protein